MGSSDRGTVEFGVAGRVSMQFGECGSLIEQASSREKGEGGRSYRLNTSRGIFKPLPGTRRPFG